MDQVSRPAWIEAPSPENVTEQAIGLNLLRYVTKGLDHLGDGEGVTIETDRSLHVLFHQIFVARVCVFCMAHCPFPQFFPVGMPTHFCAPHQMVQSKKSRDDQKITQNLLSNK